MDNKLSSHLTGGIAVLLILFTTLFLYFDRNNDISFLIQAWGAWGIVLAVFLMAAIFMTPIPSEGLNIMYLKIYGVYLGTLYSWIGSVISSIAFFYLARIYGQKIMKKLISKKRFEAVDNWVQKKGTVGLLTARFLPIPAFFVNSIVGTMSSVKLWSFIWTAAVAIIPYFVGMSLIFTGASKRTYKWIVLGIVVELICITSGLLITRKNGQTENE